jgi:hypothetical protein
VPSDWRQAKGHQPRGTEADAREQLTALANRAAAHAPLDNLPGVASLLRELREAHAEEQLTALANRLEADTPSTIRT